MPEEKTRKMILRKKVEALDRRQQIMDAVLSYALSNVDDINEALAADDGSENIKIGGQVIPPITEEEITALIGE